MLVNDLYFLQSQNGYIWNRKCDFKMTFSNMEAEKSSFILWMVFGNYPPTFRATHYQKLLPLVSCHQRASSIHSLPLFFDYFQNMLEMKLRIYIILVQIKVWNWDKSTKRNKIKKIWFLCLVVESTLIFDCPVERNEDCG
jgi:hypothetical protein